MHRCIRSAILLVSVLLGMPALAQQANSPATPAATPAPAAAAAPTGPKYAEFVKIFDQWKGILQQLRDLREEYRQAKSGKKPEIQARYEAIIRQGEAMQTQVLDAALAAFEEVPTDKRLTEFLFGVVYSQVTSDQYEDVFRVAKPMIDQGIPEKIPAMAQLYSWAGNAAFAIGEWDLAEQYLKQAVKLQKTGDNDQKYLSMIPYCRDAWPKELEIRQAEAKADDLPRVVLKTKHGDIVIELFENEAPNAVANFISLVEKGFYDGLTFHRVLPAFMAQGGCPDGTGGGGPGYTIACECYQPNFRHHFRGTLSMAHAGRDTGGSQFFLTFVPTPHLDGRHTAFGRVIEGMDVLGKIQRRDPEEPDSAAIDPDKILEAKVLRKRNHPYEPKTLPATK